MQRFTYAHPVVRDLELADGMLVVTTPLLQYRDRLPHLAERLEETERQKGIRQITHLRLAALRRRKNPVLSQRHHRRYPALSEIAQQLVQPNVEQPFVQHG